jgi:ABC-type nitrate/sulfonate/bicarbonate transport system substrate-binding protein
MKNCIKQMQNKHKTALIVALLLIAVTVFVSGCGTAKVTSSDQTVQTDSADKSISPDGDKTDDTLDAMKEDGDAASLKDVVIALDWFPNTNHSGLFLARDRGYFAEEKINVSLEQSDMNFIELVATGKAELGIASQEQVLQARASQAKVPVVAVAAIVQHNTSGFASPKDRGIVSPKDFAGKTYSGWGTDLEIGFIRTLMEREGADVSQVRIISQSAANFIASMETEADFAWIYYGWDGINADYSEYPINFILLQDVDPRLDFYSPVLITSEALIEKDPELIRACLLAAKKGYEDAIDDPDAAVKSLLKAAPDLPENLLKRSQEYLNNLYIADADSWGEMDPERWENFYTWMLENNTLENEIEVKSAYSLDFLP